MCWNFAASAAMVAIGTAATIHTARKGAPRAVPITLGYFALMEGLQTAGYLVIGACGSKANQILTLLSYLHIAFQPIVINAFAMELIPSGVSDRLRKSVYVLCGLASAFMLLQLAPLPWAGNCQIGQPLCGSSLCLRPGEWHIAWDIPYNGLTAGLDRLTGWNMGFPSYLLAVFVLPLIYGAWRFVLFHAIVGPFLASQLTTDVNEAPAVWCLFSIAILIVALVPSLMRGLSTRRWLLWPSAWTEQPEAT